MSKKKKRIGRNLEGMIVETTTIERKMKNRLPHEIPSSLVHHPASLLRSI